MATSGSNSAGERRGDRLYASVRHSLLVGGDKRVVRDDYDFEASVTAIALPCAEL